MSLEEASAQALDRRPRKPYTLTKQRESWSTDEHDKFIQALHLFHRDWKRIEAFVGTKTVVQVRLPLARGLAGSCARSNPYATSGVSSCCPVLLATDIGRCSFT